MLEITCETTIGEFGDFLNEALEHILLRVKAALSVLVGECDEKARSRGWDESFRDVTGNLRSSMGGAVYDDGRVFFETAFSTVLNGSVGSTRGKAMIDELASEYANVIGMVYLAAMDYADYVEAVDSKDVIESTRLWAESVVEERLRNAIEEAIEEVNTWQL